METGESPVHIEPRVCVPAGPPGRRDTHGPGAGPRGLALITDASGGTVLYCNVHRGKTKSFTENVIIFPLWSTKNILRRDMIRPTISVIRIKDKCTYLFYCLFDTWNKIRIRKETNLGL